MQRAQQLAESATLFLVIGSFACGVAGAGFPLVAKRNGARLAIVNRIPPSSMRSLIWSCVAIGAGAGALHCSLIRIPAYAQRRLCNFI